MADKPLVWLHGEIKTPPFSAEARRSAGYFLRTVQSGGTLSMPASRPMPSIGPGFHELRIKDAQLRVAWRIIYRVDLDAVLIGDVFAKKTRQTPLSVINACKRRFAAYDSVSE